LIVAIDGPSGAGKSTLAKRVAREFGFMYLDTGALYRALGLKVLRQGAEVADDARMAQLVGATDIDLTERDGHLEVFLDGEEVSALIRTPEVSQMASRVSALGVVRRRMLELQRAVGRRGSVVAEGRDIGTVVFPEADVKIYLDASVKERARRRFDELRAAGVRWVSRRPGARWRSATGVTASAIGAAAQGRAMRWRSIRRASM
jgi:cytidylate kinase